MRRLREIIDDATDAECLDDYLHEAIQVGDTGLWSVIGDVSHGCPLHCSMCDFPSTPWQLNHPTLIERLAENVLPHTEGFSIGNRSEPFLHPDLADLVQELCHQRDQRNLSTTLLVMTAGMVGRPDIVQRLARTGLDVLWYSVDSADPDTLKQVRPAARWDQMVEDIGGLLATVNGNLHVGLLVLIMRRTLPYLAHTTQRFIELGISDFQFKQLVFGRDEIADQVIRTSDPLFAEVLAVCEAMTGLATRGISVGVPVDLPRVAAHDPVPLTAEGFRWDEDIVATDRHAVCVTPWFKARIDHQGTVFPCAFVGQPHNALGSILEQPFAEIIDGPKAVRVRQELLAGRPPNEECAACPYLSRGERSADSRRKTGVREELARKEREDGKAASEIDATRSGDPLLFPALCPEVDTFELPALYPTNRTVNAHQVIEEWSRTLADDDIRGLNRYVHVPDCSFHCSFCRCYVAPEFEARTLERYVSYVVDQAAFFAPTFATQKFACLSIGGGSPSFLKASLLAKLLQAIRDNFSFTSDAATTIELVYSHIKKAHVQTLAEFGIERASLGIQTTNPAILEGLSRPHHPLEAIAERLAVLREGVAEINLDLMAGLPGESLDSFHQSLRDVLGLRPDSVSITVYHDPNERPDHGVSEFVQANFDALQRIIGTEAGEHGFVPFNLAANNLEFSLVRGGKLPTEPKEPDAMLRKQRSIGVNSTFFGFPVLGLGTECESAPSFGMQYFHRAPSGVFDANEAAYEVWAREDPSLGQQAVDLPFRCRLCVDHGRCSSGDEVSDCHDASLFRQLQATPAAAVEGWLAELLPPTGEGWPEQVQRSLLASPHVVSGAALWTAGGSMAHAFQIPCYAAPDAALDLLRAAAPELASKLDGIQEVLGARPVVNASLQMVLDGTTPSGYILWLALARGGRQVKREILLRLGARVEKGISLAALRLIALHGSLVGDDRIELYAEPAETPDPDHTQGAANAVLRFLSERQRSRPRALLFGCSANLTGRDLVLVPALVTFLRLPLWQNEIDWPTVVDFVRKQELAIDLGSYECLKRSRVLVENALILNMESGSDDLPTLRMDYLVGASKPEQRSR